MQSRTEPSAISAETGTRFRVLVLGPFAVYRDGEPLDTSRWQRWVPTVFKLLVLAPGWRRSRDELIDLLWPDANPEAGASNLRSVLHLLRRNLLAQNGTAAEGRAASSGNGTAAEGRTTQTEGRGAASPVLSERGMVTLNPAYGWESDLDVFEAVIQEAAPAAGRSAEGASGLGQLEILEQAALLYRGEPLLEDRYEDWAAPIRERIQRRWRELCLRLAALHSARRSHEEAIRWWERALEEEPLDEEALRGVLAALGEVGRRTDALRRFRQLEQRLREEMGVAPAAETLAVVERIRAQLDGTSAGAQRESETGRELPVGGFLGAMPARPMVAREEEVGRLLFALDVVEGGTGQLVLLGGEAGAGKTRLAQEAAVEARRRGFVLATGRCYEQEREVPFYPFLEALSAAYAAASPSLRATASERWQALAWLLPEQMGQSGQMAGPAPSYASVYPVPPGQEERQRLFRAVLGLLVALAEEQPVALLLDDLHWADEASLDLLQYLARRTRGHRVLLLGAYRDVEVDREHPLGRAMRDLTREGLLERQSIHRLTPEGTAALVTAAVGEMEAGDEFAEFVYRRTKGNPFFIDTMLQALGGRYRLIRQIGAGGMGRVFEAEDSRSGRRVAVKIMLARTEADPKALHRFEQEGEVLAALDHPNIVRVYETVAEEHSSYIVMELLPGQSLGQMIKGTAPPPLDQIKPPMEQVAAALTCAHQRGIAHRDIKPDNIMVLDGQADGPRVKVTDFGIARLLRPVEAVTTMTSTGMTMGTPWYMAPEQIQGKHVDGRADIYALGAVLYQLVTGRPPFDGDDPLAVAFKHVLEMPEPPRSLNPEVPEEWEALILKALAKDPAERFQTAAAMGEAIGRLPLTPLPPSGTHERSPYRGEGESVHERDEAQRPAPLLPSRTRRSALRTGFARVTAPAAAWLRSAYPRSALRIGADRVLAVPRVPAAVSSVVVIAAIIAGMVLGHPWGGRGRLGSPTVASASGFAPWGSPVTASSAGVASHVAHGPADRFVPWGPGAGSAEPVDAPAGVAVDAQGNVYVADSSSDHVEKFSPAGQILARWGTKGVVTLPLTGNGAGVVHYREKGPSRLNDPSALAVDRQGDVYVADTGNSRIEELSPAGKPLFEWAWNWSGFYPRPVGVAVDARDTFYVADASGSTVNKFDPAGGPSVLIGSRELGAVSGVAADARGNVYVADAGKDRVLKVSPSGSVLARWGAAGSGPGQLNAPSGVALDGQGNIYVADTGNNRVVKLSPAGKPLAQWGTKGAGPGQLDNPTGVAVDGQGNVYVADEGNNRVQRLSSGSATFAVWGSRTPSPARFNAPSGLAVDGRGDVYVADARDDTIKLVSPNGLLLATWGSKGSAPGQFEDPEGLAIDSQGYVYVADTGNGRIQKLSSSGKPTAVIGSEGTSSGQFSLPHAVALDARGNIYVADGGNGRIQKLSPGGKPLAQWSTTSPAPGQLSDPDGIALDAQGNMYVAERLGGSIRKLSHTGKLLWTWGATTPAEPMIVVPTAVAVDGQGNVYVADALNSGVVKLSPSGKPVGGQCSCGEASKTSYDAFKAPDGMAMDSHGNVYVSDQGNHRIKKLSPQLNVLALWGWGNSAPGQFNGPLGTAVDSHGDVYVADTFNNRIQQFSPTGRLLAVWGSEGSRPGQFERPMGLAVDARGDLYVADSANNRVQKLSPSGKVMATWGSSGSGLGQLRDPTGVAVDGQGDVYVADFDNSHIQKLSPTGQVLAIWGKSGGQWGRFFAPYGIAVDAQGNVYVTDISNRHVDKLSPTGRLLAQWGTPGTSSGQFGEPAGVAIDRQGDIFVGELGNDRIQRLSSGGAVLAVWNAPKAGRLSGPVGVAMDNRGNVYVANSGSNLVEKLSRTGRLLAVIGTRAFSSPRLEAPAGMALDAHGNVYVAESGNDDIKKLSPAGELLAAWGTTGSVAGQFRSPAGVALDGQGNVYVTDTGNDRVQKLSPAGAPLAQWGSTGSGRGQFLGPIGVAVDAQGDVYVADPGNNRIQKFTSAGRLLAVWTSHGPTVAQFSNPEGVAVDTQGNVYVSNHDAGTIQKLSPMGTLLAVWGKTAHPANLQQLAVDGRGDVYVADFGVDVVQELSPAGNLLASWGKHGKRPGELNGPLGVAVDGQGNVYVADTGNNRIQKLSQRSVVSRRGQPAAPPGRFDSPTGITADSQGNIYFLTGSSTNRIQKLSPDGQTVARQGLRGFGAGQLYVLGGMAVAPSGTIYVSDELSSRIYALSPTGRVLSRWGSEGAGLGQFNSPAGLALDAQGDIYVADTGNGRVEELSATGQPIAQFGSAGIGPGRLQAPSAVAVDGQGDVYVADPGSHDVQKFSPTGSLLATWGTEGSRPGQLESPAGLAIDAKGDVWVADSANNTVQELSPRGALLGQWGSRGARPGQFDGPSSVTIDRSGRVYATDRGNNRIQRLAIG